MLNEWHTYVESQPSSVYVCWFYLINCICAYTACVWYSGHDDRQRFSVFVYYSHTRINSYSVTISRIWHEQARRLFFFPVSRLTFCTYDDFRYCQCLLALFKSADVTVGCFVSILLRLQTIFSV